MAETAAVRGRSEPGGGVLPRQEVHVICNPAAGRGGRRKLEAATRHLESGGVRIVHRETSRRGDAETLARAAAGQRPDAVVVAGGDGTINEVVNGLAYSGVPLGILPLGTANVFALELGLPRDPLGAAEAVLRGRPRTVDLGKAGERYFLVMAGVGFDAQVIYHLDLGLKAMLGKLAYVATGFRVLLAPPRRSFEVRVGSETIVGYGAIIGRGRYYGGSFQATPLARLDRPELDVCVFTRAGTRSVLRYVLGIASGRHLAYPDVVYRKADRLALCSNVPLRVQADGDLVGTLPLDFSVAERALTVLVPDGGNERS